LISRLDPYQAVHLADRLLDEVKKLRHERIISEDDAVILDCAERHLYDD